MTIFAARSHVRVPYHRALLPLLGLGALSGLAALACGGEASTSLAAHPPSSSAASAAPDASAAPAPTVTAPPVASAVASSPAVAAPPPASSGSASAASVAKPADGTRHPKVVSIGMHVAGGPFDEPTKVPFKRAVEPHYPRLLACLDHVTPPQGGDAGVDLAIDAKGGKAKVTNPRSTIKSDAFVGCVVAFFESIEFEPPKNGRTNVSYSVRFTH